MPFAVMLGFLVKVPAPAVGRCTRQSLAYLAGMASRRCTSASGCSSIELCRQQNFTIRLAIPLDLALQRSRYNRFRARCLSYPYRENLVSSH